MTENSHTAIIGGGMTGISAALELSRRADTTVTLIEKNDYLGGLSTYYTWDGVTWDRYYHVVLSTDTVLLDFLRELGLDDRVFFTDTKSGFYGDGKLVSMSSPADFLAFPFLSLWQKFRLGMGILYSSRVNGASKLDRIFAREWLTRVFGRRVYEKIWDPLLRSKLGGARDRTSAAFIWATIKRLYGARSGDDKQEQMGHVHGGYRTILDACRNQLDSRGVEVKTGQRVESVTRDGGRLKIGAVTENGERVENAFDSVLLTIPSGEIVRALGSPEGTYFENLAAVEYLGVMCVFVVLSRGLSPYYVTNLLDPELPFTGIIEASNVVDPAELDGKHLVYLPKYVPKDDPAKNFSDDEIVTRFVSGLKKVHPDLKDAEILHTAVFREDYVQPLQDLGYLERSGGMETPIEGVYVCNTSMIENSTLNNNAAITLGRTAAGVMTEKTRVPG